MITFNSRDDIPKARLPTHVAQFIESIFNCILNSNPSFNAEHDGRVVVITPTDTDEKLCGTLGMRWRESLFEGVSEDKKFRCLHAVILAGNQYATSIIVPLDQQVENQIIERLQREMV